MTTKREFRTVGAAMTAEARKTGRASLRGIVGGAMMAAALVLGMTACSSENDLAGEPKTIETQATVIHVTVGAGITDPTPDPSPTREGSSADDGAAAPLPSRGGAGVGSVTRSTVDYSGGTRTLQFTTGDKLYVWGKASHSIYASGAEYYGYVLAGMLALDAIDPDDPTKATFSGDLSVYEALVDGDYNDGTGDWNVIYRVTYPDANRLDYLPYFISSDDPLSSCDYVRATLIHEGTESQVTIDDYKDISLPTYDCAATVEALMTTGLVVSGSYNAGTRSFALTKDTAQPIVNCTIAGLEGSTDYQFVLKKGAAVATSVGWPTDAGGTASFAFISRMTGSAEWTLDVTKGGSTVGTISLGSGEMALASMVYNVIRKWTGSAFVKYVNLTGQTGDVTVKDGYTVEGTLSGHQLLIADGATVTLSGASVTAPEGYDYGAIRCLGNATIILTDGTENTAQSGLVNKYAAVSVPEGKTLNINGGSAGTGKLTADARSRVDGDGYSRAGIGGGSGISCGKITITGGNVTAYGNNYAAGIGGGYDAYFDDITITGGNVTATGGNVSATGGSEGGAGIGCHAEESGFVGSGSITISGGTVTATGGGKAAGIGTGDYGKCGTITIGSGIISVTATKGADGYAEYLDIRCIGKGKQGTAGTVKIDGQTITDDMFMKEPGVDVFAYDFDSDEDYNDYVLDYNDCHQDLPTFPNITLDGNKYSQTWTLTHK